MQANVPQPSHDEDETDDVDEDLKKLQISLEGGAGGAGWGNVTEDPSIQDYLQYYKWEKKRKKKYLVNISEKSVMKADFQSTKKVCPATVRTSFFNLESSVLLTTPTSNKIWQLYFTNCFNIFTCSILADILDSDTVFVTQSAVSLLYYCTIA